MKRRIHTVLESTLLLGVLIFALSAARAGGVKTFEVKAEDYEFIPETITVNQGDRVIIKALSIDKDHGLGIKAYNIKQDMPKGKWVTIEFTADKKGEFPIHCTKFCGWKHFWMTGKLIVK
jgi:heme/copper-type cytochrome/quinol oxidase subunit 2